MQLMLAYRFLRKISDWTIDGFYSEVLVTGGENVPPDGPLIIAATHHNEIIDIAALSVTIPYRRRVCYWAKSTLFKNPVAGSMLTSAGSIPVHRNPNSSANGASNSASGSSQAALFRETSAALAAGEVIGVFPEGTSYTEPGIVQVKDGAAWAAVEYAKSVKFQGSGTISGTTGKELLVVPAAVVYTDKSQYQSRVCVRYGKPISIAPYAAKLVPDDDGVTRAVVKEITAEIEVRLKELTINAPDWDTLNSARAARELLSGESQHISLNKFVGTSQALVNVFSMSGTVASASLQSTRKSLTTYLALLHFSGISHGALNSLYPVSGSTLAHTPDPPTVVRALYTFLLQFCCTLFHPRALAFFPALLVHAPAYATGWFAAHVLSPADEEETKAQLKAIFGGFGMGLAYGAITRTIMKLLVHLSRNEATDVDNGWINWIPSGLADALARFGHVISGSDGGFKGVARSILGAIALMYGTTRLCWTWHNALVGENYIRMKRLIASYKILAGLLSPRSSDLPLGKLRPYSRVPLPAENPYITRRSPSEATLTAHVGGADHSPSLPDASKPPPVGYRQLVRPLLLARSRAHLDLGNYLDETLLNEEERGVLTSLGARGACMDA
ncbi:hypothetical protein BV22DRAFT_1032714 [Leucogyrophana mollusca]|uniref:Uncharacterized protein n=1 Tax=Leucogyrophana mollusca TaxID=85980 RepID=A0ACB8BLG7_9AGAM|nr:hypothetical protein BV22DRAFT_1032714 [Leucogyrophana mollusca]